jgi:hypothetical protein
VVQLRGGDTESGFGDHTGHPLVGQRFGGLAVGLGALSPVIPLRELVDRRVGVHLVQQGGHDRGSPGAAQGCSQLGQPSLCGIRTVPGSQGTCIAAARCTSAPLLEPIMTAG